MPIEIRLPRLTDTMTAGAVVAWRKRPGDAVKAGEVIAEVEADKSTVDIEAPEDGTLGAIVAPAGSEPVAVGAVLALLHRSGDAAPVADAAPAAPRPANGHPEPPAPRAAESPAPRAAEPSATPLARGIAAQSGLDLAGCRGTGPQGRVMKADVLAALAGAAGRGAPAPPPAPAVGGRLNDGAPYDEVPHSPARQVIARRLGESKRTVPHYYLAAHCRIDALLGLRAELTEGLDAGPAPTINDFVVRAAAVALRKVPEANVSWTDAATRRYRRVDLAVAVAADSGLVAPVVRDADRKGLLELAAELRDLAARARAGRLRPEEYQGGTFTVSNLGMYGVDEFYAIVNPPQAAILAVGAAGPRPVARAGAVEVGTVMTCTLSADHRVLDGALGARFLSAFRGLVERPVTMLV